MPKEKNLHATVNYIWNWKLEIAHGAKKSVSSAIQTTKNSERNVSLLVRMEINR